MALTAWVRTCSSKLQATVKNEQSPRVVSVKEKALFCRLSQYACHNELMITADITSI